MTRVKRCRLDNGLVGLVAAAVVVLDAAVAAEAGIAQRCNFVGRLGCLP